jgi:hypothetical protein
MRNTAGSRIQGSLKVIFDAWGCLGMQGWRSFISGATIDRDVDRRANHGRP